MIVVVSGHVVDAPDRERPRFPQRIEDEVASAIGDVLDRHGVDGSWTCITGGACGADILVAEAAIARGATCRVLLALPPDEFVESSVRRPTGGWVERFERLVEHFPPKVQADELGPLAPDDDVYRRHNRWAFATALAMVPIAHVRCLAVWDGDEGLAGGTGEAVDLARRLGVPVDVIDPTALLGS